MLFSVASFSVMNLLVKGLAHWPSWQTAWFRCAATLAALTLWGITRREPIIVWPRQPWNVLSRAITGTISMLCFFASVKLIPLGNAVSLNFLAPALTILIAIVVLKERVSVRECLFMGLVLLGGMSLLFSEHGFALSLGAGLGALGAAFGALSYTALRKSSDSPLLIVFAFSLLATITLFPFILKTWSSPTWSECILGACIGLAGMSGQLALTQAYQGDHVTKVAPISYLGPVLAALTGWLLYAEVPTLISVCSLLLIVGGNLLLVQHRARSKT
jgi:drug/metabolite transporter (DMT)-like permease